MGSGAPVLLGHSLFCTGSMWSQVLEHLATGHRFVNIEVRGHRGSSAERPFTLGDLVDDWLGIMDAEQIERAVLCGLSMGGFTAMRLALRAPHRVRALILLDTESGAETGLRRCQYELLAWMYKTTGLLPVGTLSRAMFGPDTREHHPEQIAAFIDTVRGFDRRQLGHAMRAVFRRDAVDVRPVKVPVLVATGEHDAAVPPNRARRTADQMTRARFELIPAAGHLSAVEQPVAVARLIDEFLDEIGSNS